MTATLAAEVDVDYIIQLLEPPAGAESMLVDDQGRILAKWGDSADGAFDDHLTVARSADDVDASTRSIEVSAVGPSWSARWSELERATQEFSQ